MSHPNDILKQYWGYDSFREPQDQIIDSVLSGKDTMALLPTGGGKSICFQVPAMILPGLCLVISPLIALMRDQVQNLNSRGIPATFINSSMDFKLIDKKLQKAIQGEYKFLYIAPERLKSDMFSQRLNKLNISLLAVDEAHCISQWGYDFRPAYQQIGTFREKLPGIPAIALTASATPEVKADILEQLKMPEAPVFSKSFKRDNLEYRIIQTENTRGTMLSLLEKHPGTAIIYTRTRRRAIMVADFLRENQISAASYHGGMSNQDRSKVQEDWIRNKTRVIASTNAFGMGIDKPDVRLVIHYNLPQDLESYYQEAGRAGRDGKPALAVAFDQQKDKTEVRNWIEQKYPAFEKVEEHYDALMRFFRVPNVEPVSPAFNVDLLEVSKKCRQAPGPFYHSIQILHKEGVITFEEQPDAFGRVTMNVNPDQLLEYKAHKPAQAAFIDFMLRQAGGVIYTDTFAFLPRNWARKFGVSAETLSMDLNQLKNAGIISYYPPREKPVIFFNTPKHKLTRTELSWHRYNLLKDLAFRRLEAMFNYVESSKGCRSAIIQTYFGEDRPGKCGKCDLCIQDHSLLGGMKRSASIEEEVQEALAGQSMPFCQLVDSLNTGNKEEREEVIRKMLDRKVLLLEKGIMVSLNA